MLEGCQVPAVITAHVLRIQTEVIAVTLNHLPECPFGMIVEIERAGLLLSIAHQLVELLVHHVQLRAVEDTVCLGMVGIADFLNPNLVRTEIIQDLLLGKNLLRTSTQPVRESRPTVFACLQAAVLLDHPKPLLRRSLLLADTLHGTQCIADEHRLHGFSGKHITDVVVLSEERTDILGGGLDL